jgi:hypothetical protein
MGASPLAVVAERAGSQRVLRPRANRGAELNVRRLLVQRCVCGPVCRCSRESPGDRVAVAQLARAAGNSAVAGLLQRDEAKSGGSKLDEKAAPIVKAAQDSSKPIADRAVQLVRSIISTYLSADAGLVKDVKYDQARKGLNTESSSGATAVGIISVGDKFVEQATERGFARRVIQVDHELEHVRQHRGGGMGGKEHKAEREFLAFHREALEAEFAGTGRIAHATRVDLIDAALGNYYCLSEGDQKKHAGKRDELLEERKKHDGKAGNSPTDPPTACKQSE